MTYYGEKYGYDAGRFPNAARDQRLLDRAAGRAAPRRRGHGLHRQGLRARCSKESRADTDSLKGKIVALIGGAGFIGHNLALELQRARRGRRT